MVWTMETKGNVEGSTKRDKTRRGIWFYKIHELPPVHGPKRHLNVSRLLIKHEYMEK
jgi:hypothetical protein